MEINIKKCPITLGLLISIVGIHVLSLILGISENELAYIAGYNPGFILISGEYYRFITANFIHFGITHILMNAYSLYNIGFLMERILGFKKYLCVVAGSMISTTVLPYIYFMITHSMSQLRTISGGISGMLFGILGALMALSLLHQGVYEYLFKQVSVSLIMMFALSIAIPSISFSGHLSGFVGGFVVMYIIEKLDNKNRIIN